MRDLNPRVCDCEYCNDHPSAIVSRPDMLIELRGDNLQVDRIGDQLADFYRCAGCGQVLAVGCVLDGELRGAVNSRLLNDKASLGDCVPIQPRLLPAVDKLERWRKLWGRLIGV